MEKETIHNEKRLEKKNLGAGDPTQLNIRNIKTKNRLEKQKLNLWGVTDHCLTTPKNMKIIKLKPTR